jgi:hypothetical protein
MAPSLKPGDLLQIMPCAPDSIVDGDVVVFEPDCGGNVVAHRVLEANDRFLRTGGDANERRDPREISRRRILGKVVAVDRGGEVHPVHGGLRGRLEAFTASARGGLSRFISRLLHWPYHFLADLGVFQLLRPVLSKLRVVAFQCQDGVELRLFLGAKPIGLLPATRRRWIIKRPFRLVLRRKMLEDLVKKRDGLE